MSISIYEASIPHFVSMLGNLSAILDKVIAHIQTKNIEESVFINARLAPDMYPLSQQIQIASYMAKACAARLAGIEIPSYDENEPHFPTLRPGSPKPSFFCRASTANKLTTAMTNSSR